jgi:hypothetical protein
MAPNPLAYHHTSPDALTVMLFFGIAWCVVWVLKNLPEAFK